MGNYMLDLLRRWGTDWRVGYVVVCLVQDEMKDNLGEEVFTKDAKPPKTKYKKKTDDGYTQHALTDCR